MRKGEVGSFKSEMPESFIERFDEMSARWNNIHNFHEKWIFQITKLWIGLLINWDWQEVGQATILKVNEW